MKVSSMTNKKARQNLAFGWKMGLEPTTNGTTIHYSNQLSYIHHLRTAKINNRFEFQNGERKIIKIKQ